MRQNIFRVRTRKMFYKNKHKYTNKQDIFYFRVRTRK